jgi:hypothetical protein
MFTAVLWGVLAAAQPKTVTFTHGCHNSAVVLEAFGQAIGEEIKPAGSVKQDYFLLRLVDVPVDEAKSKIAEVLNATWTRKDSVTILDRTPKQDKEDRDKTLAEKKRVLVDWVKEEFKGEEYRLEAAETLINQAIPLSGPINTPNFQTLNKMNNRSPAARMLYRFILAEVDRLALMQNGDFALLGMPGSGDPLTIPDSIYNTYLQELEIHKEALEKTDAFNKVKDAQIKPRFVQGYDPENPFAKRPDLRISIESTALGINFTFGAGFQPLASFSVFSRSAAAGPVPTELTSIDPPVQWPEKTKRQASALMAFLAQPKKPQPDRELQALLSDPVTNEPLFEIGSEWLLHVLDRAGLNGICVLNDGAAFFGAAAGQGMTIEGIWPMMTTRPFNQTLEVKDGWLIMSPQFPAEFRDVRVDRPLLRQFIADEKASPGPTIASTAKLVSTTPSDFELMVSAMLAGYALGSREVSDAANVAGKTLLRIFHRLGEDKKNQAYATSTTIKIPTGDPQTDRMLNQLVYGKDQIKFGVTGEKPWDLSGGSTFQGSPEAMQAMPNGIPRGSIVTFKVYSSALLYAKPSQPTNRMNGMTADQIGEDVARAKVFQQFRFSDYKEFRIGQAERLVAVFSFQDVGPATAMAHIDQGSDEYSYVPVHELPEPHRSALEAAIKQKTEEYEEARKRGGGGQ